MDVEKDGDAVRTILELDVDEVSLVDRAANLRRFLVIKRLEEVKMPNFETDLDVVIQKGDTGKVSDWLKKALEVEDAPKDEITKVIELLADVEKADAAAKAKPEEEVAEKEVPEDLKTAITEVAGWMKKMSKGPGAPTAAIGRVTAFLGQVAGGKYPKPSGKKKQTDEEKEAAAKKAKEEEDEKKRKADEAKQAEAKKAAGAGDEIDALVIKSDGTVVVNGAAMVKGKKFTASRTNQMKEMALSLIKLLGEVGDEETTKALVDAVKAMPTSPKFTSGVPAKPAEGVKKDEDGEPPADEEKAKLEKTIVELQKRLGDLESARPASAAVETDGEDGKTDIQKSFWGGRILP